MTEKQRFEYNYKTGRICDNESNFQCTSNMGHIVTKLNNMDRKCKKLESDSEELSETNLMLEKQLKRLEIYKSDGLDTIERLEEALENNKKCSETIDVLHEENVQLKSEIQQLKIDYSQFEELKQEYISRKELTYSEKLLIEDFYKWLHEHKYNTQERHIL